jgi:hypothetical protein
MFKILLILFFAISVSAQGKPADQVTNWPLVELPFNQTTNYAWPSMQQSLMLSSSVYQTAHTVIERKSDENDVSNLGKRLFIVGFDFVVNGLPLGSGWMHEEWHRAVMTNRHVASQNDVYKLNVFSELIAVSHVDDEELIRLKKDFPADQVRLSAAGIESQTAQNFYLEKAEFFDHSPSWDQPLLWLNHITNFGYIQTCTTKDSTRVTKDQNSEDGTDISKRDFTGLDPLGWVYDLFRPDEPYEARGTHPSGVGINRYRTLDNLTDEEKSFLSLQKNLSLLNFVDPFLFNFREFSGTFRGEPIKWNAKLQHYLTSFGYDVDVVLMANYQERNYLFVSHQFFNNKRYFPGFTLELYKWPVAEKLLGSIAISVWEQPLDHLVNTDSGFVGGSLNLTGFYQYSDRLQPFLYMNLKDRGWEVGQVDLGRGFLLGSGLSYIF